MQQSWGHYDVPSIEEYPGSELARFRYCCTVKKISESRRVVGLGAVYCIY